MNIPERFWKTATGLVGILIALAAVVIVKELKSIGYVGVNPNMTNTITVDGSGDAYAVPDIATFSFTVTQTATSVAEAQTKTNTQANAAIKALKDGGIADKDIQTTSYTINPRYEYHSAVCPTPAMTSASANGSSGAPTVYCPSGKQVLAGYDVNESVAVKLHDLSKAGSILSLLGGLGVQNVSGPNFSVENPEAVQAQARSKAIDNAQTKARELARELGVSLARVTSFYESNGPMPIAYGMGGAKVMAADISPASVPVPQIATGEQKVTDNVTITYEIK